MRWRSWTSWTWWWGYLEEMRHGSARSSTSPSTPTTFSSSSPTTPRSAGRCLPADELLRETKAKGSLVERIAFLESRVLRMEEERLELEGSSMSMEMTPERMGRRLSSSVNIGAPAGRGGEAEYLLRSSQRLLLRWERVLR